MPNTELLLLALLLFISPLICLQIRSFSSLHFHVFLLHKPNLFLLKLIQAYCLSKQHYEFAFSSPARLTQYANTFPPLLAPLVKVFCIKDSLISHILSLFFNNNEFEFF